MTPSTGSTHCWWLSEEDSPTLKQESRGSLGQRQGWVPGFQIHIKDSSSGRGLCFHPEFWFVRWEGGWGPCLLKATGSACPPPQACGVDYEVKAFCAENLEEKIHKR